MMQIKNSIYIWLASIACKSKTLAEHVFTREKLRRQAWYYGGEIMCLYAFIKYSRKYGKSQCENEWVEKMLSILNIIASSKIQPWHNNAVYRKILIKEWIENSEMGKENGLLLKKTFTELCTDESIRASLTQCMYISHCFSNDIWKLIGILSGECEGSIEEFITKI